MKKRLIASLVVAMMLVATMAVPAMAVEQPVTATVTVGEYINFTITDYGAPGFNWGTLSPGSANVSEAAQGPTTGAVRTSIGADTNVPVYVQLRGTEFSASPTDNFSITNAQFGTLFRFEMGYGFIQQ